MGLLGFAKADWLALENTEAAYWQTIATQVLDNMVNNITLCQTTGTDACFSLALKEWQDITPKWLPQGQVTWHKQQDPDRYAVQVQWQFKNQGYQLNTEILL